MQQGWFAFCGPDPLLTIMVDEMQLPEGVRVILTTLEHDGIIDCPPQTIEAALQRLALRVLASDPRAITRTTIDEKAPAMRSSDRAGTLVPTTRADAPSGPYARVQGMSAPDDLDSTAGGMVAKRRGE